jgi:uncharacterized protein (DUF983 family)
MNKPNTDHGLNIKFEPDLKDASADIIAPKEPRAGDLCPKCNQGRLDYDGLLNLTCPRCGYSVSGCFT